MRLLRLANEVAVRLFLGPKFIFYLCIPKVLPLTVTFGLKAQPTSQEPAWYKSVMRTVSGAGYVIMTGISTMQELSVEVFVMSKCVLL